MKAVKMVMCTTDMCMRPDVTLCIVMPSVRLV